MRIEKTETVNIEEIKVVDRARKDLGKIEELAESIRELGLLQPVVITEENVLVAGERRLAACKLLGWTQIEARRVKFEDYLQQLKAERDENICRKGFTFSEMVELGKKIEAVEQERARQRQAHGQTAPGRTLVENFPQALAEKGKTRDTVAAQVGFGSGKQYEKAKFIVEHADPETVQKIDAGEISIHRAYQELKEKLETAQKEAEEAKAREEAWRAKVTSLEKELEAKEKDLAEARAGSLESEKLKAETEKLRKEIKELKSRPPEKVTVEVVKEIEKPVPDPKQAEEIAKLKEDLARSETARTELEKELQEFKERSTDPEIQKEIEARKKELAELEVKIQGYRKTLKEQEETAVFMNFARKLFSPLEKQENMFDQRLSRAKIVGAHRMEVRRLMSVLQRYVEKLENALEVYDTEGAVVFDVPGKIVN